MEKYFSPEIEIITLDASDIITTSAGTEGPMIDAEDPLL